MPELIEIGVSGLQANQTALSVTGNNIANVNVDGYSRQRVEFGTMPSEQSGAGFIGNGVTSTGVVRIFNEYLEDRLRLDSSAFNELDIFNSNSSKIDNILGSADSGLTDNLDKFFTSFQTVSNDPSSIAARQLVLSDAGSLVNRFQTLNTQLQTANDTVNLQMTSIVSEINTYAHGIADLNTAISISASANIGQLPNDLLDQRDQLLRELSELVGTTVVQQNDLSVNVFVGKGQALVVGSVVNSASVQEGSTDVTRRDIFISSASTQQQITDELTGGQLGGLLRYRDEVLDPAFNQLGRVALAIAETVNDQHQLGMDLDGDLGGFFFEDINALTVSRTRVIADTSNTLPNDRVMRAEIEDLGALTDSDYTVSFAGPTNNNYIITRVNDDVQVAVGVLTGTFPETVNFDGVDLVFESGSFQQGDAFLVEPTRFAARDIEMQINNSRDVALAVPFRTEASTTNIGTGSITPGIVLDTATAAFSATAGQLSPPIIIRFTSTTTYDVLDYSDPANPLNLNPPLLNQVFTPGVNTDVFNTDPNATALTSDGTSVGLAILAATNAYPAETFTVTTIDPVTNVVNTQTHTTTLDDSAQQIASDIDALNGISATARSEATLSNFTADLPATLAITLNGQAIAGSDSDTLAVSINNDATLTAQGITATSNGTTLTVTSSTGVDLVFAVTGSVTESVDIEGPNDVAVSTAINGDTYTIGGLVDVVMDDGVVLTSTASAIFDQLTTPVSAFLGYQVTLSGQPQDGDVFTIDYNTNGFSDNRNALLMVGLQGEGFLNNGSSTYSDSYGSLIEIIGNFTNESAISKSASLSLLRQSQAERESVSGVNLDEEAAKLVEFELAYNASAQIISVARSIFETLLRSVGG